MPTEEFLFQGASGETQAPTPPRKPINPILLIAGVGLAYVLLSR